MATHTQQKQVEEKEQDGKKGPDIVTDLKKDISPFKAFLTKFNNDWVMNFASGLSFAFLTALFPIAIAIIAITGLVIGDLNPGAQAHLIDSINALFQNSLSANGGNILKPALLSLSKNAGLLGIFSIIMAIFGGSRLFITIEGYFDIIYHTRPRPVIKQNIMALLLTVVFIILVPIMIFAASGPALVFSLISATPLAKIPFINLLFGLGGILLGVLGAWVFFLVMYIVIPNQRISFRNSWLGALVAAVLVQLYLTLFPFYVTHFMTNYTGSAGAVGFAVIFLVFLYYFAVILLLGAEINAFFLEKIRATPDSIPAMIHQLTSHLSTSEKAVQNQASVSHKGEEPKEVLPKDEAQHLEKEAQQGEAAPERTQEKSAEQTTRPSSRQKVKPSSSQKKSYRRSSVLEVITGTALAFVVELFRLRRRATR